MTVWRCASCDCIIEYNKNINWIKSIKKCRLHKRYNGQMHLDQVMAQCRRFSYSIPNPTETEIEEIELAVDVNKKRIRMENLDNFHEHLPTHHPRSFFDNLKRVLRLNR